MKIPRSLKTLTFAFFLALTSATSQAEHNDLVTFFQNIEGSWQGQGTYSEMTSGGGVIQTNYFFTAQINYAFDHNWVARTITYKGSSSNQNSTTYKVSGDMLFVSSPTGFQLVQLMESSPYDLAYRVNQFDAGGRLFTLSFYLSLGYDGILYGQNTVELNGIMVGQDSFSASMGLLQ